MKPVIEVQPAPGALRDFARWATAQEPKLRTVSPHAFAVPPAAFTTMPEELLIGARVDGHLYVSPAEDAVEGHPAHSTPGLLGVATPEVLTPASGIPEADAVAMVAATHPGTVEAAMTAVLTAADVAQANATEHTASAVGQAPVSDGNDDQGAPDGVFPCRGCDREFSSVRGRDAHSRRIHPED